jgi:hypothetical protein
MDKVDKWGILTDDWKKIPQNLRFIFLAGVIFIFNSWLLDHWLINGQLPYKYWGVVDIRSFGYSLGLTLILICTVAIVFKQFYLFWILQIFRNKYSFSNLDKTYHLGWFRGKLMLFDKKKKLYYHVYPWGTAQDLLFVGRGWEFHDNFKEGSEYVYDEEGSIFKTKGYKNGGSITTQR